MKPYHRLAMLLVLFVSVPPVAAEVLHTGYAGTIVCAGCHADQTAAWRGSHHDLAMQVPAESTVLGDFSGVEVTFGGITNRFYRTEDRFMIRTEGPDGKMHDYRVKYTFGAAPLQQYLLELPGGRLQAFGIAWDSRPAAQGGQRWFHLYPDDLPRPGDRLHWTALDQNWNHMCAECHSTDLLKRYDAASDSFATSYAEIDVGCEACHGPGADHIAWARQGQRGSDPQLAIRLDERRGVNWMIDPSGKPRRSEERAGHKEIATCARCHSRRGRLTETYTHGAPIGDSHRVALLQPGLYHPDGQVLEEVYVYGSFLQSRMHAAGVTCSDCHEPHTLKLHADGDGVCLTCHTASRYLPRQHHHHEPGGKAARCVGCHMPATTYMVVDPRRDHSFRVPRPDLSAKLGTPDACTGCHIDRDPAWAARAVRDWLGRDARGYQRHAEAFAHGEAGRPVARTRLLAVAGDTGQSAIARATAVERLGAWLDREVAQTLAERLNDPAPLVRRAAVEALTDAPLQVRALWLPARLHDPVRDVRQAAGTALADVAPNVLTKVDQAALDAVLAELRATLALDADRPEAQLNLAILLTRLNDLAGAERAYRTGLKIDPDFVPAIVNLADLLRATGREIEGNALLKDALERVPESAALHYAYGLSLVRRQHREEALASLRRAAELEPENVRYGFVLAVALHDTGEVNAALTEIDRVLARWPYDRDSLTAAVVWARQRGREPRAEYTARLLELQRLGHGR